MMNERARDAVGTVSRRAIGLIAAAVLLLTPQLVQGADVTVNCGPSMGKGGTITAALGRLDKTAENTVRISGTCTEWVRITGFENLTLRSTTGASIVSPDTDPPDGNAVPVFIVDAGSVAVNGLAINAKATDAAAVECSRVRFCRVVDSTVQGADVGVLAWTNTNLYLTGATIRNSAGVGVQMFRGIIATVSGTTIEDVAVGIQANYNSTVSITGGTSITANGGFGVDVESGSVVQIGTGVAIHGGGSRGAVGIGTLSLASIGAGNTFSGADPVINCRGKYAVGEGNGFPWGLTTNCLLPGQRP